MSKWIKLIKAKRMDEYSIMEYAFNGDIKNIEKYFDYIKKHPELFEYIEGGAENGWQYVTSGAGLNALLLACANEQPEAVKLLLKHNADVNMVDHDLKTPLMYACQQGQLEIVKLLLKNGANIDEEDIDSWKAIDYAKHNKFNDIVRLLQSAGAKE